MTHRKRVCLGVGYVEDNTAAHGRTMKGEARLVWNIRRIKEVRASWDASL